MPKGYWVAVYSAIHDPEKLASYAKLAGPPIEAAGGRILARGNAVHAFENGLTQRTTVIEFPSVDAAYAAHESPGYQEALKLLDGGVSRDLRIVEGFE